MKDYNFSIQDFVQRYPLQSWLPIVLRALENELKYTTSWRKNHTRNSFKKIVE